MKAVCNGVMTASAGPVVDVFCRTCKFLPRMLLLFAGYQRDLELYPPSNVESELYAMPAIGTCARREFVAHLHRSRIAL